MKVTEIISEGEGLNLLGKALGAFKSSNKAVLGSVKEFVEQAGERIASIAKSRGISLDQAAEQVFKVPTKEQEAVIQKWMNQGYTRERAMQELGLETHPYYQDPKLKSKAISAAKEKLGSDTISRIKDVAGTTGTVIKNSFLAADWVAYLVAQVAGLAPPYMQFRKNMEGAAEYLDSGEWTQEQFDGYANRQVGILIGRWTEVLAAGALARLVPNIFGKKLIKSENSIVQSIGRSIMIAGSAGAASFMAWCNNPDNANAFAKFMCADFVSWLPDTVGGIVRSAVNEVAGGAGLGAASRTGQTSNTSGSSSQSSNGGQGTSDAGQGTKPATQQGTMTTAQLLGNREPEDYKGWQEIPNDPSWIRNPADPMDIALKPANWKKPN